MASLRRAASSRRIFRNLAPLPVLLDDSKSWPLNENEPMTTEKYVTNVAAMGVATLIFFVWGFFTCLNDILIPHLKAVFELSFTQAMLVQFTFFGAYFLMSLPAEWLIERLGYKNGMVAGLVIVGIGAAGFWPAAQVRLYSAFLATLFVLASGVTVLQMAANQFVSLLGPERTASSRLTLAQAFNSLGTTVAPLLGGWLILSSAVKSAQSIQALPLEAQISYKLHESQSVQGPYLGLAIVAWLLAIVVFFIRLPQISRDEDLSEEHPHSFADVLHYRHVVLGVIATFCYVGAEVSIGSLMVNYFSLPHIGGVSEAEATHYVSVYWFLAMLGRLFGSALLARFSPRLLLSLFAGINVILLVVTVILTGKPAVFALIAIGLFNSIMFPTIFTLGIARLGALTGKASGLLIMAIVGGAIVPSIQGYFADHIGLQLSFLLPAFCYAYIVYYGVWGAQVRGLDEGHSNS